MSRPSNKVMDHFNAPRGAGAMDAPDATGQAGRRASGPAIRIHLRIGDGRVQRAMFEASGCGFTIAAGSATTELAAGKTLAECRAIDAEQVSQASGRTAFAQTLLGRAGRRGAPKRFGPLRECPAGKARRRAARTVIRLKELIAMGRKHTKHKPAARGKASVARNRNPTDAARIYRRASSLAAAGKLAEATCEYRRLDESAMDSRLAALVASDLAAIAAVDGQMEAAHDGFCNALRLDPDCQAARANLVLFERRLGPDPRAGPE